MFFYSFLFKPIGYEELLREGERERNETKLVHRFVKKILNE
jgi:hypothetical protein